MGRGRKSANAELNLVPYIDLLSTLICFLLITAVWQQISAMTSNGNDTAVAPDGARPPDTPKVDLSVSLYLDRIEAIAGNEKSSIVFINGRPDYAGLVRLLRQWKERWPDRGDVSLHSDSMAPYKNLIGIMDTLKEAQFEDIGVNTN